MMNVVAGSKDFQTLTINHLKACVNAEHNAFVKAAKNKVIDHYEEAHQHLFFQFTHDRATLLNKDKCQCFGMQFTENQFTHNNAIALCFRKPLTHKSDKSISVSGGSL